MRQNDACRAAAEDGALEPGAARSLEADVRRPIRGADAAGRLCGLSRAGSDEEQRQ